jgi:hypothetical protein
VTVSERTSRLALLGNGRTTCRASTKEGRDLLAEIDRRVHVHVAYFQHQLDDVDRGAALGIFAFYVGASPVGVRTGHGRSPSQEG